MSRKSLLFFGSLIMTLVFLLVAFVFIRTGRIFLEMLRTISDVGISSASVGVLLVLSIVPLGCFAGLWFFFYCVLAADRRRQDDQ